MSNWVRGLSVALAGLFGGLMVAAFYVVTIPGKTDLGVPAWWISGLAIAFGLIAASPWRDEK